jgi:excisionase family DNA binding protein
MIVLPEKAWFSIAEAAELLGVARWTLYRYINAGELEVTGTRYYQRVSRHSLLRKFLTD